MSVDDSKAEELEARGLYRRAAARWMMVMALCADDRDREWIKRRRNFCLEQLKRPPAKNDDLGGVRRAASETQKKMGLHSPDGEAFRNYPKK